MTHQHAVGGGRSSQREVRNPVFALPAAKRLAELDPATREVVADILADLARDAGQRAQASWLKNKGPMAAYWKAVGVYAKHIRQVLRSAP